MDRLRRLGERWRWLGRVLDVHERVGEVNGGSVSSSVTLTFFVALFPLALAAIAIVGFLAAGDADVTEKIIDNLSLTGAAADLVTDAIETAADSRRAASIVGFVGLLWAGLGVTNAVALAVRAPWQLQGRRRRRAGQGRDVAARFGPARRRGGGARLAAQRAARRGPARSCRCWSSSSGCSSRAASSSGRSGPSATSGCRCGRSSPARSSAPSDSRSSSSVPPSTCRASSPGPRRSTDRSASCSRILAWLALFARLMVYASATNTVLYEARAGTVGLEIRAPKLDSSVPLEADRGGAVKPREAHAARMTESRGGRRRSRG